MSHNLLWRKKSIVWRSLLSKQVKNLNLPLLLLLSGIRHLEFWTTCTNRWPEDCGRVFITSVWIGEELADSTNHCSAYNRLQRREAIWLPEKRFGLCFVLFCNNVVKSLSFNSFPLKLDDAAREKEKELRQKRVRSLLTQIYSVCC